MPDLSTTYLGLPLKNPIVPSSTPLTRDGDAALHLEDAGAAAIVMHSLFEEDVRNDERMIDRFLTRSGGFAGVGAASVALVIAVFASRSSGWQSARQGRDGRLPARRGGARC